MLCFDLEDVIFIINKWVFIRNEDSEDEKDDKVNIWEMLKLNIQNLWLIVNVENIFKMDFKMVIKWKYFYCFN